MVWTFCFYNGLLLRNKQQPEKLAPRDIRKRKVAISFIGFLNQLNLLRRRVSNLRLFCIAPGNSYAKFHFWTKNLSTKILLLRKLQWELNSKSDNWKLMEYQMISVKYRQTFPILHAASFADFFTEAFEKVKSAGLFFNSTSFCNY